MESTNSDFVELIAKLIGLLTAIITFIIAFKNREILFRITFEFFKKLPNIRGVTIFINLHEVYKEQTPAVGNIRDEIINFIKEQINELRTKNKYRKNNWNGFFGDIFFYYIGYTDTDTETEHVVTELIKLSIKLQLKYKNIGVFIRPGFDNKKFTFNKKNAFVGECFERAFNLAQMPISRHLLLHHDYFESDVLAKMIESINAQIKDDKIIYNKEPFKYFDIHKKGENLYNFYSSKGQFGTPDKPINAVYLEYRDTRKFISRLAEASKVTIVGLTHENTLKHISDALIIRKNNNQNFWDDLKIIFPSVEYLKRVFDHLTINERKRIYDNCRRDLSNFLLGSYYDNKNQWELLEYEKNLPFIGTKLISFSKDGEEQKKLRIAPILVGESIKKTHYIEIWEGMSAFTEVDGSFEILCNNSSIITEWNLYLDKGIDNHLIFNGLIERKNFQTIKNHYIPVVLVVLHENFQGRDQLVLQLRDKYNSRTDFDKFSNISGRLIDLDVFEALGIKPSEEYINKRATQNGKLDHLFKQETNFRLNDQFEDIKFWKTAAIRELEEEVNLKVTEDKLIPCGDLLEVPYDNDNNHLLFRVFSFNLDGTGGLSKIDIEKSRPNINLHYFDLTKINLEFHNNKFNRLLHSHYKSFFLPLFTKELKIK
jgi:hypothetical protein